MGKVFAWREILENRIPSISSFAAFAEELKREVRKSGSINRAMLYGSVAQNKPTRRSDFDALFVVHDRKKSDAFRLISDLDIKARAARIPTQFVICSESAFRKGLHSLRPLLSDHLIRCANAGGAFVGAFSTGLLREPEKYKQDALEYFARRMAQLNGFRYQLANVSEDEEARMLKKVIETARNAARKMVQISLAEKGGLSEDPRPELYSRLFSGGAVHQFEDLAALDKSYSDEVARQANGDKDEALYRKMLGRIRDALPKAVDFLEMNANILA